MNSNHETDDETPNKRPKLDKKKSYSHKFCNDWLNKKKFRTWLEPSKKGEHYYRCKLCGDDNKGGISAVKKHMSSQKHQYVSKSAQNVRPINEINSAFAKTAVIDEKVKVAELKICMFISEHNTSFNTTDHLVQLIKAIGTDPEVVKKITCNRTKSTAIVNNVIGSSGFDTIIKRMKNNHFSLIIDESTDHSSVKHLAMVVRMLDYSNSNMVRDEFLSLIKVTDASALGVHKTIKNFFEENLVPYKNNLIGFSADGASAMFGVHRSVKTLLESEIPNLYSMKCICHSIALVASYATKKIPDDNEMLVREIYTYFQYSFKRQTAFKEFQSFTETKPHKLLKPCQTRWLSLHSTIKRILEQISPLKLYFQAEYLIDQKAKIIFEGLKNPHFELYLNFLDYFLPILNSLNLSFKSEKPQIHLLYSKMSMAYKTILECYTKPEYLNNTDIEKIQYRNPTYYLKTENIYLGGKCMAYLSNSNDCKLSNNEKNDFINNCLNFYIECAHQLFKRFPFNSNNVKCLKALSFLNPQNVKNINSVVPAAQYFETSLGLNLNDIDREWRQLRNIELNFDLELLEFWKVVVHLNDGNGDVMFPFLSKLINFLIILPHSSACVERIFSCINLNKTKVRNRLSTESFIGLLHSKNILNSQ